MGLSARLGSCFTVCMSARAEQEATPCLYSINVPHQEPYSAVKGRVKSNRGIYNSVMRFCRKPEQNRGTN